MSIKRKIKLSYKDFRRRFRIPLKSSFFEVVNSGIMFMVVGSILYKKYFPNIDSNNYLSSNDKSEKSFDFEKFNGEWSLMQFTSNKGNKITIKDNTKISKGKFYIVILDSEYNIIAKKNKLDDKGNLNFTTLKDGKYKIGRAHV